MKRIGIVLLVLLIGIRLADAQTVTVLHAEIVTYGIYTVDQIPQGRNSEGVLQSEVNNIKLAVTTRTVAAKLGNHFGFEYKVIGAPEGAQVKIREIIVYPPGGLHPPGKEPINQYITTQNMVIGGNSRLTWYAFDDPWELVPGTWTFQVWYGNRKLAEQSFTVVAQ